MKVFQNQLGVNVCKKICEFVAEQLLSANNKKNPVIMWSNFAWPQHIVKDSTAVFIFVTPQQFLKEIQHCLEQLSIFDPEKDYPLLNENNPDHSSICLIYVWTPQSYIPAHSDGKHRKTVTIYCNESWGPEKGGILKWIDPEKNAWQELVPSCGTVVFNDKDEIHTTTPVQARGDFRVSLQIFLLSPQQSSSATY
ncbi:2OG-Fe(II) oxygenase [bacterium]|nr:2OG-Fe(II) oxygenase [bacterium]